jgi:uncharacterized protein (TIGR03083 family)
MTIDYLDVIATHAERIVDAYETDADAAIPWSDRWTVGTVARHVAGLHHVVAQIIAGRPDANFGLFQSLDAPAKNDTSFVTWFRAGTTELIKQLCATPSTDPCWTFSPEHATVGFWARRMTHEAVIHRWDVETATGATRAAIDPAVAADGIDEYLDVYTGIARALHHSPAGPTICITTTDTNDTWYLELPVAGTRVVTREPIVHTLTIRGAAQHVLLTAWGRLPLDSHHMDLVGNTIPSPTRWAELLPPT